MEKCKRCGSDVQKDTAGQYICGICGFNTRVDNISSKGKSTEELKKST